MDECKHCTVRGNLAACSETKCNIHDSWYVQALLARHNALEAEIEDRQEVEASLTKWVAELGEQLDALREAVAWERECCQDIRPLVAWAGLYVLHGEDYVDAVAEALREIQDAARAEVDRLLDGAK